MGVKCFLVTDSQTARRYLRRYWQSEQPCTASRSSHEAKTPHGIVLTTRNADGYASYDTQPPLMGDADPRWPTHCDYCGTECPDYAERQMFFDEIYVDADGKQYSLRAPVDGMMWDAWWMGPTYAGPDGKCLVVVCPGGGQWMIDSRASNCTLPDDSGPFETAHRCWVRHGVPPLITVDKNGRTCSAGGGSIVAGSYHGFLVNGEFT